MLFPGATRFHTLRLVLGPSTPQEMIWLGVIVMICRDKPGSGGS